METTCSAFRAPLLNEIKIGLCKEKFIAFQRSTRRFAGGNFGVFIKKSKTLKPQFSRVSLWGAVYIVTSLRDQCNRSSILCSFCVHYLYVALYA